MKNLLFLDIETIPSESARQRLTSGVSPPATITKAETLAAWEAEKRGDAEDKAFRDGALCGLNGEIIVIGWTGAAFPAFAAYWPEPDREHAEGEVPPIKTEGDLLRYFCWCMHQRDDAPLIVGHAALTFDCPYIWQRCKVHGVRLPAWWPSPNTPDWKANVYDTKLEWSGRRGKPARLSELCELFGIPSPKGEMDGSQVYDAWLDGRTDEIAEYCRRDVEAVREVYRRLTA